VLAAGICSIINIGHKGQPLPHNADIRTTDMEYVALLLRTSSWICLTMYGGGGGWIMRPMAAGRVNHHGLGME
jgi:hypothetical protein